MLYQYSTLKRLRDEGLPKTTLSDAATLQRIRLASEMINKVTGQYFSPTREDDTPLSGEESSNMIFSNFIPILQLERIIYEPIGATPAQLEDDEFAIKRSRFIRRISATSFLEERHPRLFNEKAVFLEGTNNYKVTGYTGWLENLKNVSTTLTTTLTEDALEMTLDDVTGFDGDDMVVLYDSVSGDRAVIMLNSVDYTTNKFQIDAARLKGATFSDTVTTVTSFGSPPNSIIWACNRITISEASALYSSGGVEVDTTKIKTEKTDNYSYTKFSPRELGAAEGGISPGDFTGSARLDAVLGEYSAPPVALMV